MSAIAFHQKSGRSQVGSQTACATLSYCMRRLEQVRISDLVVRTLVTITFLAFFAVPERWMFRLMFVNLVLVGIWGLLYPEGVLGWAKTAHRNIDVEDSSIWWVPRLVGCFFLVLAIFVGVAGWR
jgi:hypothetical protein